LETLVNLVPRRIRWRRCLALAAAAIVLSPFAVATRAPATGSVAAKPAQEVGGQQPQIAWERSWQMRADLDAMQAAGMTWVRADFAWSSIQAYGRNTWNWGSMDAFVKAANERHLKVVGILDYSPRWARAGNNEHSPPTNPDDYAKFAAVTARRYASMGVHTWEIWNEPNLAMFWAPKPDPVAYATLLRRAYPAIKNADPEATVISGGLAPSKDNASGLSPMSFLVALYYHGAKGNFDAFGLHPYSYPYEPMHKATWNVFYNTPNLHKVMSKVGDGNKKIWGTELGFPTGTNVKSVSEQEQADDLVAAITAWRKWSFTGPLFIFQMHDSSTKKSSLVDNMGILRVDGQAKPAYGAIRHTLR
jgi:polysaccharide biosynthesis protein PslG